MERDGWLMVLVGLIALVAPLALVIATLATGLVLDFDTGLPRSRATVAVVIDPRRAAIGVGMALLLTGAAAWIIKRTDWSAED